MHDELEVINAAYRKLHTKRRAMLNEIEEIRLCVEDRDTINVEILLQRLSELKRLVG